MTVAELLPRRDRLTAELLPLVSRADRVLHAYLPVMRQFVKETDTQQGRILTRLIKAEGLTVEQFLAACLACVGTCGFLQPQTPDEDIQLYVDESWVSAEALTKARGREQGGRERRGRMAFWVYLRPVEDPNAELDADGEPVDDGRRVFTTRALLAITAPAWWRGDNTAADDALQFLVATCTPPAPTVTAAVAARLAKAKAATGGLRRLALLAAREQAETVVDQDAVRQAAEQLQVTL